jgi:3-isopropylmalate/(R)-2-methylmalate dehydratase small subunit
MIIADRVIKYGDNVDTDVIIPARYLNTTDEAELASHCFEDLDEEFKSKIKDRKIVVGGENFGCGSSREHAPLSIKVSGVKVVIASSFARIFYRNAINVGLPVIVSRDASAGISDGDELEIDLDSGVIKDVTTNKTYDIPPIPGFIQEVIASGGYISYTKKQLAGRRK